MMVNETFKLSFSSNSLDFDTNVQSEDVEINLSSSDQAYSPEYHSTVIITDGDGDLTEEEIKKAINEWLDKNPVEGVNSYPTLLLKPSINGVELLYNRTAAELGLQEAGNYVLREELKDIEVKLPDWIGEEKPQYTAEEVGADPAGTAILKVSDHNIAKDAHNDIRNLMGELPSTTDATSIVEYINIKTEGIATNGAIAELEKAIENKADKEHEHDESDLDSALVEKINKSHEHSNKTELDEITSDKIDVWDGTLEEAKSFVRTSIAELINGAPDTLDTLGEISTAMHNNAEVVDALSEAIGNKANTTDLTAHVNNKDNPHQVTASQVGALPLSGGTMTDAIKFPKDKGISCGSQSLLHLSASDNLLIGSGGVGGGVYFYNIIRPGAAKIDAIDIGTSDAKWRNIYLSGNISDGTNSVKVVDIAKKSDIPTDYATSGHTHDDKYYTESEIDTKVDSLQSAINDKAPSEHGNHVPAIQTANNAVFLRNDNTWQTVTPANIGAAPLSHTHDERYYTESEIDSKVTTLNNSINKKVDDFSIEIYNGNKGTNPVRFASFNYSTCTSETGIAAKISMVSGHGNGVSYTFLQDVIIKVSHVGVVEVDNFKYYGASVTYDGKIRQYGDIFWLHDATNKIVDFYVLMGQYARVYQTPWKRVTYSTGGTVTQHTSCTLYSSGEKSWANNSDIALMSDFTNYYTKEEINDALASGVPSTDHTHDDRYYTEAEIDDLLALKSTEIGEAISLHDVSESSHMDLRTLIKNVKDDVDTFFNGATFDSPDKAQQVKDTLKEIQEYITTDAEAASTITSHIGNKSNPHGVTASQVGALPLSGGTMTGELIVNGGDQSGVSKIVLQNGKGQITANGTQTLFGFTANSTIAVGHSSFTLAMRGSGTRPKYNSKDVALVSDIPSTSNFVTLDSAQTITGIKTFNAPANADQSEQTTTKIRTSNGGAIVFGKEAVNSGTMIRLDQTEGTCRLRFRASATPGAMVWEQPEEGAQLYIDLGKHGTDYRRISFPETAGTLALAHSHPYLSTSGGTLSGNLNFDNTSAWITPYLLAFKNADSSQTPTYPYTGFYQWGDEWQVNARDANNAFVHNIMSINLVSKVANFSATPTVNGSNLALASQIPTDYAPSSHGTHVPTPQAANNAVFLRNDNTWATITPGNIGAPVLNAGNTFDGEQKMINSSYCPTMNDIASGVGCSLKNSRACDNQLIVAEIFAPTTAVTDNTINMTSVVGEIGFYNGGSGNNGQFASKTLLGKINSNGWVGNVQGNVTGNVTGNVSGSAGTLSGLTASIAELNYVDGVTSNIQTQLNSKLSESTANSKYVQYVSTADVSVGGTTKPVYRFLPPDTDGNTGTSSGSAYFPEGIIMGGTAASAGLMTRGICGIDTPDHSSGACTKNNVYINYDGDNTYRDGRHVVLQAGSAGTHYGNNVYEFAAVRGDAMKNYCDNTYDAKGAADAVRNELLNGAGGAFDTLKELGDLISGNQSTISALQEVASSKANASDLTSHTGNKSNPHGVTAEQVGALSTSGGTLTGSLSVNGQASLGTNGYVIGTWFQTTVNNSLGNTPNEGIVVQNNGWFYRRTLPQILSDIGAVSTSGSTMTGKLQMNMSNPHIHFKDTAYTTDWYVQAYQDQFGFGTTWNTAVKSDKNGNMTVAGTVTVGNGITLQYDASNECLNFVFG